MNPLELRRRRAAIDAAMACVVVLLIVQMWLLTATLERATDFLDAMDSTAAQLVSSIGSNKLNEFRFQFAHRHQPGRYAGFHKCGRHVPADHIGHRFHAHARDWVRRDLPFER